jgi:hypothetical protein
MYASLKLLLRRVVAAISASSQYVLMHRSLLPKSFRKFFT